jgi:hypothetical protein
VVDPHGVLTLLLHSRILDARQVIEHGVRITTLPGRHHNAYVESGNGVHHAVKQGDGRQGIAAVAREARIIRRLNHLPLHDRPALPRLVHHDDATGTLVTEITPGATDLRRYHVETRRFPLSVAAALGGELARLHRLPLDRIADASSARPLVLALQAPTLEDYRALSSGCLELVAIVQAEPGMGQQIAHLDQTWRDTCLVHGELKLSHCILSAKDDTPHQVQFVDWESAGAGDPAWDVGSIFGGYLGLWLASIQSPGAADPATARLPLECMQPFLRQFWRVYLGTRALDVVTASALLQRSIRLSAVRLIQTAIEELQAGAELSGAHILLLQLSANLLAQPVASLPQVLGCSLEEALAA